MRSDGPETRGGAQSREEGVDGALPEMPYTNDD
ncbi:MAG: hypothetical protein KatS3mg058_1870 [Roseiflexus sp.]|nr:MAG: hypothetical protein KatS3mg058_1870 [Roseiflexus sp.]